MATKELILGERRDELGHHWVVTDWKKLAICSRCQQETGVSEATRLTCNSDAQKQMLARMSSSKRNMREARAARKYRQQEQQK